MENVRYKVEKLHEKLTEELAKEIPDMKLVNKLRGQIFEVGLALTYRDFKGF